MTISNLIFLLMFAAISFSILTVTYTLEKISKTLNCIMIMKYNESSLSEVTNDHEDHHD